MKIEIEDLRFDGRGLVPAVVQDARTGEVLMLAYMSAESLRRTLLSGETCFWSRSRAGLWHKGASSGHTQRVLNVAADCDADALLVAVEPNGPACHTGARSCFAREVVGLHDGSRVDDSTGGDSRAADLDKDDPQAGATERRPADIPRAPGSLASGSREASEVDKPVNDLGATLAALYELIERRRRELPEGSYTTYLFREGLDKILKKVGEESAETIIAAKNADSSRLVAEVSDLVYHLLVLLAEHGATLGDVNAELARRAGKGGRE